MLFFTIRVGRYHSIINDVNGPKYGSIRLFPQRHTSFWDGDEPVWSEWNCAVGHHRNEQQSQVKEGEQVEGLGPFDRAFFK